MSGLETITETSSGQERRKTMVDILWRIVHCAPFYFLVLNSDFKIKLYNHRLKRILSVDKKEDFFCQSWLKFVETKKVEAFKRMIKNLLDKGVHYSIELSYAVVNESIERHEIAWFHLLSKEKGEYYIVCIGVDTSSFISNNIENIGKTAESIKSAWEGLIKQDKQYIDVVRESLKEEGTEGV